MSNKEAFNPLGNGGKGDFDYVGTESGFITSDVDGITTIRWRSTPGGVLYDMTIDDAGTVVLTPVTSASGGFIPVWFTMVPQ